MSRVHEHTGATSSAPAAHDADRRSSLICPITGHRCEGDLAHLCEDYGCTRKGGLSPHSAENA